MKKRQIKKTTILFTIATVILVGSNLRSQKVVLETGKFEGQTHIAKENFPKDKIINMVNGWGGMTVAINELKAGTDFTPILKGLKDDLCQVPHWGYLEKGKIRVINKEGQTEQIVSGEVFYMPPGHTLIVDEDAIIIDFSPEKEMIKLNDFVLEKISKMQSEN